MRVLRLFTALMFQVKVFWVVTPCSVMVRYQHFTGSRCSHLYGGVPEDGGSMNLWNVGILQQRNTASQPRRPQLEVSLTSSLHFTLPHVFLIWARVA